MKRYLALLLLSASLVLAQSSPPAVFSPDAEPKPPLAVTSQAEMISQDEATTFKVNVKLVLVRVVARDLKGNAIGGLKKEDFQLFDKGKPQTISQFSVERPGTQVVREEKTADEAASAGPGTNAAVPERFVAFLFDDIHLKFGDLAHVRDSFDHYLTSLLPTDRVAIFTTSGQTVLDFTDDREKLKQMADKIQPRPILSKSISDCPDVSYYMADQIVNKNDALILQEVQYDALNCAYSNQTKFLNAAAIMARTTAQQVLAEGDQESHVSLTVISDAVRRIAQMPGQRNLILVSPGFIAPGLEWEYNDIIEHALRSQVIIGTLDARGVYTIVPGGDISNINRPTAYAAANQTAYAAQSAMAEGELLSSFADETGGIYFRGNNDLEQGFKRVAAAPEFYYVLGFAPQNLKPDGTYHAIRVTLKDQPKGQQKISLQARRGYYAPKHAPNPAQDAKQEIEDAIFSQEEMHDLPVDLHTQFFKPTDDSARLTVLAHVDAKRLRFRKIDGRNGDDLTVVSALFNRNGNFLQANEKTVTMRLKDDTLEHKLDSGLTLKTSFDVKPGSYLVRLVVRDGEGQLMSAENGAVEIP